MLLAIIINKYLLIDWLTFIWYQPWNQAFPDILIIMTRIFYFNRMHIQLIDLLIIHLFINNDYGYVVVLHSNLVSDIMYSGNTN